MYNNPVQLIYDPAKNEANIAKHGVALTEAEYFEWYGAVFAMDERKDYGEKRIIAVGEIHGRLHVLVYTLRDEDIRLISLRKANPRERRGYDKARQKKNG